MTFKEIREEYLNDLRVAYKEYFDKKTIKNIKLSNLSYALVEYYKIKYLVLTKYHSLYGDKISRKLEKSEQCLISIFLGDTKHEGHHNFIKSDILFWSLFTLFIKQNEFPSFQLKKYQDAFYKLNRNKTDMYIRISSYVTTMHFLKYFIEFSYSFPYEMILIKLESYIKKFNTHSIKLITDHSEYLYKEYRKIIKDKSKLKIYRGFDIDVNENIRVGRKLKGNMLARTQESGIGLSYTFNKNLATEFALNKWKMLSINIDWNGRVNWSDLLLELENVDVNKMKNSIDRKPSLASYEIDVKDIVFIFTEIEEEVVVFPDKVKLLNYKFLKYSS